MDVPNVVYWILGFLFSICFVVWFFGSRRDRKTKKAFQSIDSFTPTHMFSSSVSTTGVAIDPSRNKIAFCRNKALSLKREAFVYDFNKINSVETVIDGTSVYKTNRGNQVVRGAVGGLLLGATGLLIGALTGTKTKKEKISKISIRVSVSDIDKPSHEIIFYDGEPIKKEGIMGEGYVEKADEWVQRLNAIMAIGSDQPANDEVVE